MIPGLALILIVVLVGPIFVGPIERNIELFFLVIGALTPILTGRFGWPVVHAAATEPIALTVAVLLFGTAARLTRPLFDNGIRLLRASVPPRLICLALIFSLGVLSSVITAVIAALLLVEAIAVLKLDRQSETAAVVLACFAIGLGSGLTPTGGPVAAIAVSALDVDFCYLIRMLGPLVLAGILIVGALSLFIRPTAMRSLYTPRAEASWREIAVRALRVYAFVAGLVGLSWGFQPLVGAYVSRAPSALLFWVNSISAMVDNAALTAAEMSPVLGRSQQRAALMGLLISGGMLIPGNIPNIVAANRLGISSREWAQVGLLVGLPLMALCSCALYVIG